MRKRIMRAAKLLGLASLAVVLVACHGGDDNVFSGGGDDSGSSFQVNPQELDVTAGSSSNSSSAPTLKAVQSDQLQAPSGSATMTIINRGSNDIKDLKITPNSNLIDLNNQCSDELDEGQSCKVIVTAQKAAKGKGHITVSTKNSGTYIEPFKIVQPKLAFESAPDPIEIAVGQAQNDWCNQGEKATFVNNSSNATAKNVVGTIEGNGASNISVKPNPNTYKKNGETKKRCQLTGSGGPEFGGDLAPGKECQVCLKADGPPDNSVQPSDPDDLPQLEISADNAPTITNNIQLKNPTLKITLPNNGLINDSTAKADGTATSADEAIEVENTGDVIAYFKTTGKSEPDKNAAKLVKPNSNAKFGNFFIDNVGANVKTPLQKDCRQFDNTSGDDKVLTPGTKCHLPLKVLNTAFGMAQLKLAGNFSKTNDIFVNIAPTTVQFLTKDSSSNEQVNDDSFSQADYAVIPDSDTDVKAIQVKNTGAFKLHKSNFAVQPSDFFVEHVDSSCTKLAPDDTCKIEISRDDASAGEEGIVQLTAQNILNGRARLPIGVEGDVLVFPDFKQDTMPADSSKNATVTPMVNYQKVWVVNAIDDGLKSFQDPSFTSSSSDISITKTSDNVHPTTCSKDRAPAQNSPCKIWIKLKESNDQKVGHTQLGDLKVTYTPTGDSSSKTDKRPLFVNRYILAGGDFTGGKDSDGSFVSNTLRLAQYGPKPSNPTQNGWSSIASIGARSIKALHMDNEEGILYVGGQLGAVNKASDLFNITRFDGRRWFPLAAADGSDSGLGTDSSKVNAITQLGDYTYVTGTFDRAGQENNVNNIARWKPYSGNTRDPDLGVWKFMGKQGSPGLQPKGGWALLSDSSNDAVVVGGQFDQVGQDDGFNSVAKWDNSNDEWKTVASGLTAKDFDKPRVQSIIDFDGSRLVGGNFTVGSNNQFGLAEQSNSQWQTFADSPIKRKDANSGVLALDKLSIASSYSNATENFLYTGGQFTTDNLGNHLIGYSAAADNWFSMGDPQESAQDESPIIRAVKTYQTSDKSYVVAGGRFNKIDGKDHGQNIALCEFDSNKEQCDWQALGQGVVGGQVRAIEVLSQLNLDILS